jgi:hypothetical protein
MLLALIAQARDCRSLEYLGSSPRKDSRPFHAYRRDRRWRVYSHSV